MNVAYHNARTISLNGYIYVMGNNGTCGSDTLLEIYDPKNDEWHKLAIINGHMFDVSLVTYDSFLYAFLFESSCPVQRYDVSKNCWTKVCILTCNRKMSLHKLMLICFAGELEFGGKGRQSSGD